MGAAEARLFVGEGARVAFGDILEDEGRRLEKAVTGDIGLSARRSSRS